MAERDIKIEKIRNQIATLQEAIRAEILEQPFQKMSAADVKSLSDKVQKLSKNLSLLIAELEGSDVNAT